MAIAYRGSAQQTTGEVSGTGTGLISGNASGDFLIGIAFGSIAFTADPHYTSLFSTPDQNGDTGGYEYIAWRKADGSANDNFNPTYTGTSVALYVISFSGADSTTQLDDSQITQWHGSTQTVFPPNSTPSVADCAHVAIYAEGSGPATVTTPPTGYTETFANNATSGWRAAAYYKLLSGQSGVAQGPINMVWSGVAYGPAISIMVRATSSGVSVKRMMTLGVG